MARKMVESGIIWIGKIPANWTIHPVYYYFSERRHKNSMGREQNLLSLSYGNIIKKNIEQLGGLIPESYNTYNIIENGDIVIRPTDLQNDKRSLRTGLAKEHGIITSAYITLKPHTGVNSAYFQYLLHTYDIMKVFYNMGNGVRQSLNFTEFSKLMIFEPPMEEQQKIAAFLDDKCAEIDSLISDIQREIDKLERLKRSVITEAVTKGLDRGVELKDSCINWIGSIPANWDIMPNKYLMWKKKCIRPVYGGEDIISLSMNGVIVRDLDAGGKMPTTFDGYQYIEKGNLLMCLFDIDVTPRCIGLIKCNGVTSPAYSQFVMKELAYADYFNYYYTMLDNDKTLVHLAKNLRHSLTEEQLGRIPTIVPPIAEQKRIAAYLDARCDEFDTILSEKQKQIEILQKLKKSVIYEYVTGKKEVK